MVESGDAAFLFTDIEGSTALLQRIGPRYTPLLERHHEIISAAVAASAGTVQGTEGDAFFATFDSASAALNAAVDAQVGLEAEAWPADAPIRVRMGLHVGGVAMTSAGLVGLAIHHAARVTSAAHGGQIVVSSQAKALTTRLPPDVSLRSLGTHQLRDVGLMQLFQVDHPDLRRQFPALRLKGGGRNNIPAPLTSLIGREDAITAVQLLLHEHRLVTLTGVGGCGKTRLAVGAASSMMGRFADGVWFVDLTALADDGDVATAVATAIGVDALTLLSTVADRQMLIVLDNCEHVLERSSKLVVEMLEAAPEVTVLTTSRALLGLPGEQVFVVPSLGLPGDGVSVDVALESEAVRLFLARAALVRQGPPATSVELDDIVRICRSLEGLPLAIELAAARLRTLTPRELVQRLDRPLSTLVGGPRGAPARQRALRATVEWSVRLLAGRERKALQRFAVFHDGFDLEAAEMVCDDLGSADDIDELVTVLLDSSLLRMSDDRGVGRYRMHEVIRQYALELVADRPGPSGPFERHARCFASRAASLRDGPAAHGEVEWIRAAERERENYRAAAMWWLDHEPRVALQLLLAVLPAATQTPQSGWVDSLIETAVEQACDATAGERALALAWLVELDLGPAEGTRDRREEVERLLDGIDDPELEARVLRHVIGWRAEARCDPIPLEDVRRVTLAADRAGGIWPFHLRVVLSDFTPPATCTVLCEEAVDIASATGWPTFGEAARQWLALAEAFQGHSTTAVQAIRRRPSSLGDVYFAGVMDWCALVEGEHGDLVLGLHLAEHRLAQLLDRPHDAEARASGLAVVAHLRRLNGDLEGADVAADDATRVFEFSVGFFLAVLALLTKSAVLRAKGRPRDAARLLAHSCDEPWTRGSTDAGMRGVEELAAIAIDLGRLDDGGSLLATAAEWRRVDEKPVPPALRRQVAALEAATASCGGTVLGNAELASVAHSLAAESPDEAARPGATFEP